MTLAVAQLGTRVRAWRQQSLAGPATTGVPGGPTTRPGYAKKAVEAPSWGLGLRETSTGLLL